MLPWIFDVDGVLCDTRLAVKLAYKEVGVEFPEYAWGLPKQEWFVDEEAHDKKNACYPAFLARYGVRSPICDFVSDLLATPFSDVAILSSASESAVRSVLDFVGLSEVYILGSGYSAAEKYNALQEHWPRGFYVDDNKIAVPPGWFLWRVDQWTP